jgi:hypothetical protein
LGPGVLWLDFCIVESVDVFKYVDFNTAPKLRTTTKEWQEKSREMQVENQMDPFTGPYSQVKK